MTQKETETSTAPQKPEENPAGLQSPWKEMGHLPTAEQLTMIAATLARNTTDTPDALAKTAMNLWLAARRQIWATNSEQDVVIDDLDLSGTYPYNDDGIPAEFGRWESRGEFPVKRDKFIQAMLPRYKSRADKLAQIAKAFLRRTLHDTNGKEPSKDDIDEAYGKWTPSENYEASCDTAKRFRQWEEKNISEVRSTAGRKPKKKTRKARPPYEKVKGIVLDEI
jgi:hypothetical protein